MRKSNFVALVLGTISGVFFALGMCMALLPEWNAFRPGVGLGCIGVVMALITVFVWRKMEHKEPIRITGKAVATTLIAVIGALSLGVGMVNVMVWENLVRGIIIGLIGIVVLLMLIPICKGLK
ncbi:MAG: hypothetical protein EOM34_10755 [Clostridia bacterium]|nr:hypothetical protein [Lachnospiraceae bacterium]NCC01137.1 hypothetical protein [Clostridia bacterium]NCD03036.1 hypothetical protein [Clostridia bacterium]